MNLGPVKKFAVVAACLALMLAFVIIVTQPDNCTTASPNAVCL